MADSNNVIEQRRRVRPVMLQVCLGLSMVALSHRAMLVALPTLTHAFEIDLSSIQWALLVYDLAVIGLVLTLGRLGDLFGRKPIYTWGFVVFGVGSAVCGLAQNPIQLIAFRIVQGIGGAMIMANGRALASNVYPPAERGKALGLTSTAYHVGYMAGPTLGGFIIDTIGWRWIFFVNVPIAFAGAYLARRLLRDRAAGSAEVRVDVAGAAYLLLGNISLVYALNQLPHLGYRHPAVFSLLAVAATALFRFIRTELRVETPILNLELFRSRLFSTANLSLFFITSTQSGIGVLLPFYLQNLIGFTPSQMGWIIIANSVVIVLVAPVAGWLSDRLGSRLLCSAGSSLIVIGQFLIASLDLHSTVFQMVLPQVLSGLGWAIFNSPNQSAILGSVPRDKVGAAAGMTVTTARVGGAIGIALSGALLTYALSASGLPTEQVESPQSWGAYPDAFLNAFSYTVHAVNAFALLAIIFSAVRGGQKE
jgi:EmrB/QacA subfamily drug resistance transporter